MTHLRRLVTPDDYVLFEVDPDSSMYILKHDDRLAPGNPCHDPVEGARAHNEYIASGRAWKVRDRAQEDLQRVLEAFSDDAVAIGHLIELRSMEFDPYKTGDFVAKHFGEYMMYAGFCTKALREMPLSQLLEMRNRALSRQA